MFENQAELSVADDLTSEVAKATNIAGRCAKIAHCWLTRITLVSLLVGVVWPQFAHATDSELILPKVGSIEIGFANRYKLGCWTPVAINLRDGRPSNSAGLPSDNLYLEALDGDSVPARFAKQEIVWGGRSQNYLTYGKIGRADGPIGVLLQREDLPDGSPRPPDLLREFSGDELPRAVPSTDEFIVQIGGSIGLPELFRRGDDASENTRSTTVVTLDKPQRLPEKWYGYDGVDLVVLVAKDAVEQGLFDIVHEFGTKPSAVNTQAAALEEWVRLGGRLIIVCGDGGETALGEKSPLARFLPGKFSQTINLRRFGGIETYADSTERLDAAAPRLSLRVPQLEEVHGVIEVYEGAKASDLPLVVRTRHGYGQVTFVGLDLHKPPLAEWPGRTRFLERLLGRDKKGTGQSGTTEKTKPGRQLGYSDLGGQLRGALDQFEGVSLVPFWSIALAAIAYVAVLFPLAYWVVIRWLRRPLWAWIVLPIALSLFASLALFAAQQAKGNKLRVNRVELVDVDTQSGLVRGTTWLSMFSPANATYSLTVNSRLPAGSSSAADVGGPAALGWLGLPGDGFGGLDSRAAHPPLFAEPYTIDPASGTIGDVPLSKWSSKSFIARWTDRSRPTGDQLTIAADGRLRGTLNSPLAATLEDCQLLHGRWAYSIGQFPAGKSVAVETLQSRTIDTWLTRRRLVNAREEAENYDRGGNDLARILELMMFHGAAGGENYTGLSHRAHSYIDLSNQLELGRAILIGRGPSCAEVKLNGSPPSAADVSQELTMYRWVLDVEKK